VRGVVAGLCAALAIALVLAGAANTARRATPSLAVYRGLGTWVDLYDPKAFKSPGAVITSMKQRGARTLYLETANYHTAGDVSRAKGVGRFIDLAHAAGIKVVAWYLPGLDSSSRDLRRSLAAIRFRSPTGQRFDSFSLDIEASIVRRVALRNTRLLNLSAAIRKAVGPTYALGAIIPSPRGMQLNASYWPGFPYAQLANVYDVFLPMGYFTFHTRTARGAFDFTIRNVTIVRRSTGDPSVPIHMIGGVSDAASTAQVRSFVQAARACGVMGASMYDFTTTTAPQWSTLTPISRAPAPTRVCA
jgi:hypothetical protein